MFNVSVILLENKNNNIRHLLHTVNPNAKRIKYIISGVLYFIILQRFRRKKLRINKLQNTKMADVLPISDALNDNSTILISSRVADRPLAGYP